MTIDDLRAEWDRELLRCDATIALIKGLPEVANGVRQREPLAIVAHEYADRLAQWRAELGDMRKRYSGDPETWPDSLGLSII